MVSIYVFEGKVIKTMKRCIHRVDEAIDDAFELVLTYNISVYDASYVQLVIKYNGKLLTTDGRLMNVQGLKKYFIKLT